jgi:hypothetical protein
MRARTLRCFWMGVALTSMIEGATVHAALDAGGATSAPATSSVSIDDLEASGESDEEALRDEAERGPVRVRLEVRPASPVIGDVLEVVLEATAEPEVELLMPQFGEALGRFEIIDFAPSERLDAGGRTVARQVYRLQPRRSGTQSIPALRVEFVDRRPGRELAPDGEDAWELLTERLSIDVAPILTEDAPLVLSGPHPDLGPRRSDWAPGWIFLIVLLAAVVIASPFAWRAYREALARRRQRDAYALARSALDTLLATGLPDEAAMDAFYVALSTIVRIYLEDRFGLRSPELTTQEFLAVMGRSPDLARSHQQMLRGFLEQADLVKFARHRPENDAVAAAIASVERFLEDTRHQVAASRIDLADRGEGAHA